MLTRSTQKEKQVKISKQKVISVLSEILNYSYMHTCLHEETHRGGVIWEICSECGIKWADDNGGKPDNAHDVPKAILDAEELLDIIRGTKSS